MDLHPLFCNRKGLRWVIQATTLRSGRWSSRVRFPAPPVFPSLGCSSGFTRSLSEQSPSDWGIISERKIVIWNGPDPLCILLCQKGWYLAKYFLSC